MESFGFYRRWKVVIYITVWSLITIAIACVLLPFNSQSFLNIWLVAVVFSACLAVITPFLWNIIKFGKLMELKAPLNLVVLFALALLAIIIWLGAGLFLLYLIVPNQWTLSFSTLPLFALIGVFVYVVIVQRILLTDSSQQECIDEITEDPHLEVAPTHDKGMPSAIDRISVKINSNVHVIPVADIYYLQSEGDYVLVFSEQGRFIKEQTMKYFEQNLPSQKFVRIHRSFIVNVEAISRIECYGKNKQIVILRSGAQLKMSLVGYRSLKASLNL
ncbi:LytR/AlgR family response regulator transcription factor [Microbacter margulisiae]|uniref:HTH LytTR-type domain-containing protein n=1 Tax=Microbacter margulisiae TaxID=1350067 RepID=A0A7W5DSG9_9PORP|nr:LytTR family DNA-binding domain-containing protein [Microbacter margulisiae]MBB3188249.1 hypothetical protein [Microbacter margulisiae]